MRELSLHISDIFENSRVAGASLIRLRIREDMDNDRLEITVTDNGSGMKKEFADRVFDPFVTSRTCRKVGLGLPLLRAATQRCNGNTVIVSEPGKGTSVSSVFQHSHIDRAPLGNIVDSLVVFLAANPKLDFVYTHEVAGQSLVLDTLELREEMGDIPLNTPSVLNWIRDYLREGLQAIGSSA